MLPSMALTPNSRPRMWAHVNLLTVGFFRDSRRLHKIIMPISKDGTSTKHVETSKISSSTMSQIGMYEGAVADFGTMLKLPTK